MNDVSKKAIRFMETKLRVQNLTKHFDLLPMSNSKKVCNENSRRLWTTHNLAKVLYSPEGLDNEVTISIGRNRSIQLHYFNDTIDEDQFCMNIDSNNNILIEGCL